MTQHQPIPSKSTRSKLLTLTLLSLVVGGGCTDGDRPAPPDRESPHDQGPTVDFNSTPSAVIDMTSMGSADQSAPLIDMTSDIQDAQSSPQDMSPALEDMTPPLEDMTPTLEDMSSPDLSPPDAEPVLEECGCYAGVGDYCAERVVDYASTHGCRPPSLPLGESIWRCEEISSGARLWGLTGRCDHECEEGELPSASQCSLPPCECFVRVSWCGASAGRHGRENLDCQVPVLPERDNDLLGCEDGEWVTLEECEYGCSEQATGTPDDCRSYPDLGEESWPDCPSRSLLHSGLHPEASDRLRCAGVTSSRITQTIGSAPASAGYHAADGQAGGQSYCAAVDLRTRDLTRSEVRELLDQLGRNGFAAWYRDPGSDGWPSDQAPHIHAVFAGVRMKSQLRGQVRDFLVNRNGLSSHRTYQFWDIPVEIKSLIDELFRRHYVP